MAEPFIGQIIMAGFNFAPRNYAYCAGQLLSIQQNTALFSLLGTTYGGDGRTTFGLPDLRSRIPLHMGQGPGLTPRTQGEMSGSETVSLNQSQIPSHNHLVNANNTTGSGTTPGNRFPAKDGLSRSLQFGNKPTGMMNPTMISNSGGSQPHNNIMPSLVVNYCIALQGIFPSRN
ncbi:MAG: phage tail protein [Candidatus Kapabacteria bacterium]|nr:phage tail protein [Candidatus Kapabacteria bacterium]MBX7155595.1 tail fiber protein [Bacteroidota bacterium]